MAFGQRFVRRWAWQAGMRARGGADASGTLTAREQALFDLLSRHRGRLFTREEIVERVWGVEFGGDDRVVDVYVKRIRRKLRPGVIETVRGAGYRHPDAPDYRQVLPHFGDLSADTRTLLTLWRQLLQADTPGAVLLELQGVVAGSLRVSALALLGAPQEPGASWEVQESCGDGPDWRALPVTAATGPVYRPADDRGSGGGVALLPLAGPGQERWATLAAALGPGAGWDAETCAGLEAVAVVVSSVLRVGVEARLRQRAQGEAREIGAELERRVGQRTGALVRENAEQAVLVGLSRGLERAPDVPHLWAVGLPVLARLAGTNACAAWLPRRGPAALACLRVDGTPGTVPAGLAPAEPHPHGAAGVRLALPVGSEEVVFHAFDEPGRPPGPGGASAALPGAAGSVAQTLSRLLYLEALEAAALTDEATGLGNRPAFLADLAAEVAYGTRHGTGFGLGLVEIGNIRSLNATVGYAGGNDVILGVARTLRSTARAEDRVYRLCGATFAVLLRFPPQDPARRALQGWRERLRGALEGLTRHVPFPLELSHSEVSGPEDARTTSELLRLALDRLSPGFSGPLQGRRWEDSARG